MAEWLYALVYQGEARTVNACVHFVSHWRTGPSVNVCVHLVCVTVAPRIYLFIYLFSSI